MQPKAHLQAVVRKLPQGGVGGVGAGFAVCKVSQSRGYDLSVCLFLQVLRKTSPVQLLGEAKHRSWDFLGSFQLG